MTNSYEPIRKHITVACPQERAFRVFTENMTVWWPKEHHIGRSPLKLVTLEGKQGGRFFEIGEDGSECEWGKVLAWEPPRKVILAWQISAEWRFDPELITEIEVTFTASGSQQTRVDLEHRNIERFGQAAGAMREQLAKGWEGILAIYAAVAH